MAIPNESRKYTYAEYQIWDEAERVELIDGDIYNMSPAPSRRHQQILRELSVAFTNFFRDKNCEVFFAPFDVRLCAENKQDGDITNVVQPDLSVICDLNKLDERGCLGAPDLIIEVLSPASVKIDRWVKFRLYERAGVQEYWLVDPVNEAIEIYLLQQGSFRFEGVFTKEDCITVERFPNLEIDLQYVFK